MSPQVHPLPLLEMGPRADAGPPPRAGGAASPTSLRRAALAVLERMIPRALRADIDTRRRALLAIGTTVTVMLIAVALLPVLVESLEDPVLLAVAIANTAGTIGAAALSLLFLRLRCGLVLAGNVIAALLFAGAMFAVLTGGGVGAPFWMMLAMVPVFAALIAGQASGVGWLIVSILFVLGTYTTQRAGVEIPNLSDPGADLLLTSVATAAVLTVLTVFVLLSEATKREAIATIAETSLRLASAIEDEQRSRDAAARADAASAAKSAFLTTMSHELRTPLNAILGYSELVLENLEERGDLDDAEDMRRINSAGKELLRLIGDVLDLSRIEAQRFELSAESFDVAALVREVAEMFRPLFAQSGAALSVIAPADAVPLHLDKGRVRQILANLLGNAAKYAPGGHVWLRVIFDGDAVQFVVEDTGPGIPPDKLEQIFEPFVQVDSSFTRRHDGAGLGLTICRRLCTLMGGTLTVRSTLGAGSAFTARLPGRRP